MQPHEWQLHMLPLDKDLLTMDEPGAYRELKAHQDPSALMRAARSIMQLQMIYGLVPRIAGKGRAAEVCVTAPRPLPYKAACPLCVPCASFWRPRCDPWVSFLRSFVWNPRRRHAFPPLHQN